MNVNYAVIFERAQANSAAYIPDLPGCMTTDRSLDETKLNIREAIQGHLDTLRQFGGPIPEPSSLAPGGRSRDHDGGLARVVSRQSPGGSHLAKREILRVSAVSGCRGEPCAS